MPYTYPLTQLQFIWLHLQQLTNSIDHLLTAIPFGKDGFSKIRVQQMLNTPNVSSLVPRREGSTDKTSKAASVDIHPHIQPI
jgi:hypothetical protein